MTSEAERLGLYNRLNEVLGDDHARTLMNTLATRDDVAEVRDGVVALGERMSGLETRFDHLETRFDRLETRFDRLETRFDRLETRLDRVDERFHELYKTIIWSLVGAVTVMTAVYSTVNLLLFG